jgi:hypothetical protein
MGTRDIYIALIITGVFILCMDYFLNEESAFCCLPSNFTDYHVSLIDNNEDITPDQIKNAEDLKVAVLPVGFFYCYPNFTHDKIFGDNIEKYMFEESICIHLWHSLWN